MYNCGYSFSLLPNLILLLMLLGVILIVWWCSFAYDLYYVIKKRNNPQFEHPYPKKDPQLNNFLVRFLYEIFFEICLCVMINMSFIDPNSNKQMTSFILCTLLMVLLFIILLSITMLLWRGGPQKPGSYEPRTIAQSFWGPRPLKQQVYDEYGMTERSQLLKQSKFSSGDSDEGEIAMAGGLRSDNNNKEG